MIACEIGPVDVHSTAGPVCELEAETVYKSMAIKQADADIPAAAPSAGFRHLFMSVRNVKPLTTHDLLACLSRFVRASSFLKARLTICSFAVTRPPADHSSHTTLGQPHSTRLM